MNTFKQKSLYVALAGVSALGVTGAAQAVSVNPDGLGQALIYPYYTVREKVAGAPFQTLLSVVNSTASAKAVKVRFLEGKNSREVLDFNLYLSKKDVWTAAIVPTAEGAGIFTKDTSCTAPQVSNDALNPTQFLPFLLNDGAGSSLDRTREGYIEIIEMGNLLPGSATEIAVTHINGVPKGACPTDLVPGVQSDLDTVAGNGGLFGGVTFVNPLSGEDFTSDAIALEGFTDQQAWAEAGSIDPTLEAVSPKISVVTSGTRTYVTAWPAPALDVDPVSAVLMHNNVYNEFVLDAVTRSETDWVVTMPTKRYYYSQGVPSKLFQRNFTANGACDDVEIIGYDREERSKTTPGSFSPPAPTLRDSICWEANVITFNARQSGTSNVLGSKNVANIPTTFENGWVEMKFIAPAPRHLLVGGASTVFNTATIVPGQPSTATTLAATTFAGLPVVGFAAITFNNRTLTDPTGNLIQSQYGGSFNHKQTRSVTGTP